MLTQADPLAAQAATATVVAAFNILLLVFAAGLVGVIVTCIAAVVATALGTDIQERKLRTGLLVILLPVLLPAGAAAQVTPPASPATDDVPTVEPRFTRIFGSDSLALGGGALSPDGRWILFSVMKDGGSISNLYTIPAGGGEARQLTTGEHMDDGAVWFPGGDRVAFRSDRAGIWAVMTVPVNRRTGEAAGPIRQVTLEGSQAYLDVSPDGDWIAYTPADPETGQRLVRIIPSTGGSPQTVSRDATSAPAWAPDGRSLFYAVMQAGTDWRVEALIRSSLDGATRDTLFAWPGLVMTPRFPNTRYLLRAVDPAWPSGMDQAITWELATPSGEALARLTLPPRMWPAGSVPGSTAFLASRLEARGVLHVLPVDGGPPRGLNDSHTVDDPLAWTPDGSRILFRTRLDGRTVVMLAPIDGGAMRQVTTAPELAPTRPLISGAYRAGFRPVFSSDGRHLLYDVTHADEGRWSLKVAPLADGEPRSLTADAVPLTVRGPGGTPYRNGDHFTWVEQAEDHLRLMTATVDGPARAVQTFTPDHADHRGPGETTPAVAFAVHGHRVLMAEQAEHETRLTLVDRPDDEQRRLATIPGWLAEPSWSADGDQLAGIHYRASSPSARIVFLDISESGEVVGEPRFAAEAMTAYWGLRWLPDGRGVLAVGMDGNVWLFPTEPGEEPEALTAQEPGQVWGEYLVSPDGRHIAYGAQILGGGSIWRVDLDLEENR